MKTHILLKSNGDIVTVHSVHSNVDKIPSRLPAAMEFWLVCLGIVAVSYTHLDVYKRQLL